MYVFWALQYSKSANVSQCYTARTSLPALRAYRASGAALRSLLRAGVAASGAHAVKRNLDDTRYACVMSCLASMPAATMRCARQRWTTDGQTVLTGMCPHEFRAGATKESAVRLDIVRRKRESVCMSYGTKKQEQESSTVFPLLSAQPITTNHETMKSISASNTFCKLLPAT